MGLKLLCIVAHPDDECFAFGGALAIAANKGLETYVLCLTDGGAATNCGGTSSNDELGLQRRAEFAASCDVLGVTGHDLIGFRDRELEFFEFAGAAKVLVRRIRELRPDVVITFGADGGLNTHPDHSIVSVCSTLAYDWAGWGKRWPEILTPHRARRLYHLSTNFFMEGREPPYPIPWTVELDISSVRERKSLAFEQHKSQAPLMERTRGMFEKYGDKEFYTLVACADARPASLENDLFAGL